MQFRNIFSEYYLHLDINGHIPGDIGRLFSPEVSLETPSSLSFFLYFRSHPLDVDSSVVVRLKYSSYNMTKPLLELKANSGSGRQWVEHSLCLPHGQFRVVFEATVGLLHRTAMALDDIILTANDDCLGKDLPTL